MLNKVISRDASQAADTLSPSFKNRYLIFGKKKSLIEDQFLGIFLPNLLPVSLLPLFSQFSTLKLDETKTPFDNSYRQCSVTAVESKTKTVKYIQSSPSYIIKIINKTIDSGIQSQEQENEKPLISSIFRLLNVT